MSDMRERLIELIDSKQYQGNATETGVNYIQNTELADYFIENGVIVLPCKVGDTVWSINWFVDEYVCADCEHYNESYPGETDWCTKTGKLEKPVECMKIGKISASLEDVYFWLYKGYFNKYVFLTKEEAEQALKEREE